MRQSNFQRVQNMDEDEFVKWIWSFARNPLFEYIDMNAWLQSFKSDIIYQGDSAIYQYQTGNSIIEKPCIVVDWSLSRFSEPYANIIIDNALHTVPISSIHKLENKTESEDNV